MHSRVGFPVLVIASIFACTASANEPAKPSSPAECRSPSLRAFGKEIKGILARSQKAGKNPHESWSKDATFRKLAASPKSTLAKVELTLRCSPPTDPSQVEIASLALQCLDLQAYLDYVKRLAKAPKSDAMGWAMFHAIVPGPRWSTRLALNYSNPEVSSTLKEIIRTPNVSLAMQKIISEILDGSAKKELEKNPVKPLLTCGSGSRG
jgi:hypothetical protein